MEDISVNLPANGKRTDQDIAQAALSALRWNNAVPDKDITVKVEDGWLTLQGRVDWQFQKDAAKNAVKDITGLHGVINQLSVKPTVSAPVVKDAIKKALERSADIEAGRVNVESSGNKVILRGKARTWTERNEIERAAWSAPGVVVVEDDLVIA